MASTHPAAVLFDMDGTLVDSEKLWDIGLYELARRYGATLSDAARLAMVGTDMPRTMELLVEDLGRPDLDTAEASAWLGARVAELFVTDLEWRPGALALLRATRAAGIPTALVTSTARQLVEVALDTLGRDSFDVVVCGDEVPATKPDPEPYLIAARLLGRADRALRGHRGLADRGGQRARRRRGGARRPQHGADRPGRRAAAARHPGRRRPRPARRPLTAAVPTR